MIFNIFVLGDFGVIYFMELMFVVQQVCNSSFIFNNFVFLVICVNEFINFDYFVIDLDGDQLVYEFCVLFLGGGFNFNMFIVMNGLVFNFEFCLFYDLVNFIGLFYNFI